MVIGGGIGTLLLVLLVMFLGGDPGAVLQPGGPAPIPDVRTAPRGQTPPGPGGPAGPGSAQNDEDKEFVSVVLADTEDVWNQLFQKNGRTYREPKLVLFTRAAQSACGYASAAVGPFYCPADETVYIDLNFYDLLQRRFGATGDFAQAYVIAHEVGHHVQNLLGVSRQVEAARRSRSEAEANRLSVRQELQADFYAGVWARHAQEMKQILDRQDLEEAIRAASAIGDDQMQMRGRGYVVPESFTHGTSEQRVRWFRRGWETGDPSQGDTFSARDL
jgi:predicted metalloprotease